MVTNRKGYLKEYYRRERAKIIERLGGCCEVCGSTERLHIHHKTGFLGKNGNGRGMLNRLTEWKRNFNDLMLLCEDCHRALHEGLIDLEA